MLKYLLLLGLVPIAAHAQNSNITKQTWDTDGGWKTTLLENSHGNFKCLISEEYKEGNDDFSVALVSPITADGYTPQIWLLLSDDNHDRLAGDWGLQTDTQALGDLTPTFNNDGTAGLVLADDRGKAITQAMSTGKTLHLSTKIANYQFDLDGFNAAVKHMADCFAVANELHAKAKQ